MTGPQTVHAARGDLYAHMAELRREGRRFAVATVVRTLGSTPQAAGAKLVLSDEGEAAGTLGGGCVEADALIAAREVIAHGGRSLRAYELTEDLAWNTGLVCGGTMWILAEPSAEALGAATDADHDLLDALCDAAAGRRAPMIAATVLRRRDRGWDLAGRVFADVDGRIAGRAADPAIDARIDDVLAAELRRGTTRVVSIDEDHDALVEVVAGRPEIVIAGGGHVALAIARQARLLEFDVIVLEDRPEFADPARFGDGVRVVEGDVPAAIASREYGWNSFVVIATRGHKLDAACVLAAARTTARYIGLLGSRRKTVLVERMLREEGIPEARLADIHAPVGLDLGGRSPAEIALSVLAEITQRRYRASGRALSLRESEREK